MEQIQNYVSKYCTFTSLTFGACFNHLFFFSYFPLVKLKPNDDDDDHDDHNDDDAQGR